MNNYPPGAANDPSAPYNQKDTDYWHCYNDNERDCAHCGRQELLDEDFLCANCFYEMQEGEE